MAKPTGIPGFDDDEENELEENLEVDPDETEHDDPEEEADVDLDQLEDEPEDLDADESEEIEDAEAEEEYSEVEMSDAEDDTPDYIRSETERVKPKKSEVILKARQKEPTAEKRGPGRPKKEVMLLSDTKALATTDTMSKSKMLFNKAMSNFVDQALSDNEEDLVDVEFKNAKSTSFVDALGNLPVISHELEILGAESNKFKRVEELAVLHKLRNQCDKQIDAEAKTLELLETKLDEMLADFENASPEDILNMQAAVRNSREATAGMIKTFEHLIMVERKSGSRPWGPRSPRTQNITYFQGMQNLHRGNRGGGDDANGKPKKARPLSATEAETYAVKS
jgi:hypothetical protein